MPMVFLIFSLVPASLNLIDSMSQELSASLDIKKVAGIFYILIGGMIGAMLAAMGELLYRSRIEARKGKVHNTTMGDLAVR